MQRALLDLARRGDEDAFADLSRAVGDRLIFDATQHLSQGAWEELLGSVTFDPTSAKR